MRLRNKIINVVFALCTFNLADAAVSYSLDPSINFADNIIYEESPSGQLTVNSSYPLASALQGTRSAVGGNIELFTSSEQMQYTSPNGSFNNVARNTLSGTITGQSYTFSSLNGQDWFNDSSNTYHTSFGANNLANQWFQGFFAKFYTYLTPTGKLIFGNAGADTQLFNNLRDTGAFAGLSDANIGYLYRDDASGQYSFGTQGFMNLSPRLRTQVDLLYPGQNLGAQILDGIQASEVVKFNGHYYYSFEAEQSGVVLNDGQSSYSGNFHFVPEPSTSILTAICGLILIQRRKR